LFRSAIHRLCAAVLHHAGDDALHASASIAIAAIERTEYDSDLADVLRKKANVRIVYSPLTFQSI
jgi:hypothetical protein